MSVGLDGQVEAVARDVGVGLRQQREVAGVAVGDRGGHVRREVHRALRVRRRAAHEGHAAGGEVAEVDGATAVRAADRDRDVLGALRRSLGVPRAEDPEPPHEVAAAVATRGAVVRADGEVDAPPGRQQLVGDLHARGPGTHHEDRARGELGRIAVAARVQLRDVGVVGEDRGDHRAL